MYAARGGYCDLHELMVVVSFTRNYFQTSNEKSISMMQSLDLCRECSS